MKFKVSWNTCLNMYLEASSKKRGRARSVYFIESNKVHFATSSPDEGNFKPAGRRMRAMESILRRTALLNGLETVKDDALNMALHCSRARVLSGSLKARRVRNRKLDCEAVRF
jgi:hypothetical protein